MLNSYFFKNLYLSLMVVGRLANRPTGASGSRAAELTDQAGPASGSRAAVGLLANRPIRSSAIRTTFSRLLYKSVSIAKD